MGSVQLLCLSPTIQRQALGGKLGTLHWPQVWLWVGMVFCCCMLALQWAGNLSRAKDLQWPPSRIKQQQMDGWIWHYHNKLYSYTFKRTIGWTHEDIKGENNTKRTLILCPFVIYPPSICHTRRSGNPVGWPDILSSGWLCSLQVHPLQTSHTLNTSRLHRGLLLFSLWVSENWAPEREKNTPSRQWKYRKQTESHRGTAEKLTF